MAATTSNDPTTASGTTANTTINGASSLLNPPKPTPSSHDSSAVTQARDSRMEATQATTESQKK